MTTAADAKPEPGDGFPPRSTKWPMDAELRERVTAALAASGLGDAVECIHTPSQLGTTLWLLTLTDERYGRDVEAALTGMPGVTGVLRKSGTCLRFEMDRTVDPSP